eukprot:Hpha_TRINITY_DN16321_c3_g6::TRINITY_DN16321_c3_g6_i1::g.57805::m.57805
MPAAKRVKSAKGVTPSSKAAALSRSRSYPSRSIVVLSSVLVIAVGATWMWMDQRSEDSLRSDHDALVREWRRAAAKVGEERARKQFEKQRRQLSRSAAHLPFPSFRSIPRVEAASLSVSDFVERFARPRIPVILTGLQEAVTGGGWNWEWMLQQCGDKAVQPRRYSEDRKGWGGQTRDDSHVLLSQVAAGDGYAVDWSLLWGCPWALQNFSVPTFFAGDQLQQLPDSHWHMRDKWPSLFVGRAGSGTALHTDALGTHFWQIVLEGSKEWVVFPPSDADLLRHLDANRFLIDDYHADPWEWEAGVEADPLLRLTSGWRGVAEAGDIVFAPSEAPHAVRNIGDMSLAVSMNYVAADNLETVAAQARSGEYGKHLSSEFAAALESAPKPREGADGERVTVPWSEFKGYPDGHVVSKLHVAMRKKFCARGPPPSGIEAKNNNIAFVCPWRWEVLPDPSVK